MTLEELEALLAKLNACVFGCGDVEYVLLNNMRRATQEYIDAIHHATDGKFKQRVAYSEEKLKNATKGDKT
jgi:hypothetical protein